jgi:hypothetical protein
LRKHVSIGTATDGEFPSQPSNSRAPHTDSDRRYSRSQLSGLDPLAPSSEATIRSLIADIEIKAYIAGSPLQVLPLQMNGGTVATVYSFERRLGRFRTGIWDGVVVLSPAWERGLTPWLCHRLQDFVASDLATFRIVEKGAAPAAFEHATIRNRSMLAATSGHGFQEVLPLPDSFDAFLDGFGRSTRRNVLRGLDYARDDGLTFLFEHDATFPNTTMLRRVAAKNRPHRQSFKKIARVQSFVAKRSHPFYASLTDADGQLVSIAGGFIEGDLALLAYQCNDRDYPQANLSLILRALIAEQLMAQRLQGLAFIGSCAGLLLRYCERVRGAELLLARHSLPARMKHLACVIMQPKSRIGRLTAAMSEAGVEGAATATKGGADRFDRLQSELEEIRLPHR